MIQTDRLIIRQYEEQDVADVMLFLLDKQQMTYIRESFNNKEDIRLFMEKEGSKLFSVILKGTDTVIGLLSFFPFFEDHSYEIGWLFNRDYTNNGYAYEAAHAMLHDGFANKHIHRVIATAQPENKRSWKLMEKLHMRREAHFKSCIPHEDGWWDEYYYAILKEEWLEINENIL